MTLEEAILARHSVRRYINKPLEAEAVKVLERKIGEVNRLGNLHIQLVQNEPKGFSGIMAYGQFSGCTNYLVVAAKPSADVDERVGYYGEQLVLLAQTLGINSCWAGLSYRKVRQTYELAAGEKVICMIALGYGVTQGVRRKSKTVGQVSNVSAETPNWFRRGIKSVLLAPTAINQQKFRFEYNFRDGQHIVTARRLFSLVGYTQMDMGIAKLHFEIGAGGVDYKWVEV